MEQTVVQQLKNMDGTLIAVGDFMSYDFRNGTNNTVYHSLKLVVGDSTQQFDVDQTLLAKLPKNKYQKTIVTYTERFFSKSGNTIKVATDIIAVG